MDCSKTEVFLKEWKRMCGAHDGCDTCGLYDICHNLCAFKNLMFPDSDLKKLQEIVQKWSDEHPQETILEHFKKILPNMCCENAGVPHACMRNFDSRLFIEDVCFSTKCTDCWNRPYEEAIRGSEE